MRRGFEVLSQSSSYYNENSNWLLFQENKGTKWTIEENKRFENALALYDKDTSDRWMKVAAMIPGKTIGDVIKHYKDLEEDLCVIESGLIPFPGYTNTTTSSSFTLDFWDDNQGFDEFNQFYSGIGKRGVSSTRSLEHERKKGVPWTKEEHRLFLMGMKKYGKGDWRNISHNFVTTRTPTQVASHAQKYFIRQVNGGKDKRRSSIHDITIVNLSETKYPSLEESNITRFPDNGSTMKAANATLYPNKKFCGMVKQECDMKQLSYEGVPNVFDSTNGNMFMMTPQEQCLVRGTLNGCQIGPYVNEVVATSVNYAYD